MFKRFRSLFITFAILGSLVILTGTRYSDTTPNPSLSITDDGTVITLSSPLVFDEDTGTAGTLARWVTSTTLAGGSILDDGGSLVHFNFDNDGIDFRVDTENGQAFFIAAATDLASFDITLQVNNITLETNNTHDIGTSTVGLRDIWIEGKIARANSTDNSLNFSALLIDFNMSTADIFDLSATAGIIINEAGESAFDLRVETNTVTNALFVDSGAEVATWNVPQGNGNTAVALGAAAVTFSAATNFVTVTGDAGTNTIATITSGTIGGTLVLLFTDALVTVTDNDTHSADSVDLNAAFTSVDDTTLTLLYDGTSWYELSRSVN